MHNIFTTAFVTVHRLYINKVERKGRTAAEVDEIIRWFTGFDQATLDRHLEDETTFEDFFAAANLNPNATLITGVVCGIRVENVEDPLMKKIRLLDKLIDELAKGKAMTKILRS
ncbi:DUF2200 domain-containing protein [Rhodococcoides yunnanense]|uniref:DUF2200 domain-containing protein n=1 Tax=Rhodococcoides yunnanense TaxID=278209 RepID=A0ABU4BFM1_9NOCA|nr:DUF2200 domain-containing protein [Rhodococcus yunnanensis]MDV6263017.1 DUF2200 domain-containing protein [Rhodococcus yunnanensis]